ncbi:hypothetical protein [Actinopolymorpha rutila]|uniref:LmbE family N-acetylglucosaminyl deacetylase n=1 Tax=Actinopolymorpha rutila TaxID=446787 RepID=A0A852ZF07_9ACTN|nr:hypothetical protein [Actinopolymorpha rutila]NYH91771.1 LmbE family N-acetylglucosaminyl deacetylase [Actinopolymorpha rutila]
MRYARTAYSPRAPNATGRSSPAATPTIWRPARRRCARSIPRPATPYAFPELAEEGLAAWTVRELWLSGHPTTNHVVDVTETFGQKMAALYAHQSQHPEPDQLEPRLREGFGRVAATAGLPQGHLAEGYFVVETG